MDLEGEPPHLTNGETEAQTVKRLPLEKHPKRGRRSQFIQSSFYNPVTQAYFQSLGLHSHSPGPAQ